MNNLWCKIFIFLNLLFIVDIITPSRSSADDNKIENEQLWTWPKDTFFKKSEINQNTELMKYLQSEKIDFFFNGLFPETFLIKKSSSENIYRNILKNIFTNLNKSATAEYLIRLNQIDNYNTYFVFTEDLNFWLNSWSDVVRKKIFIFINPNTFNEKSLIKYLAHEIAIISDQKIKFIKKELFLTQKILNIENLDSNDFYPMYTFSIITNPILHSVFSMIRANKFENIVFDEINELKTSDFFNKKNLTCIQILEQNLIEYLEFYNHQNVPILSLYNHAYIESLKKYVARFNISTKDKKILFSDLLNFDKLRDFMQSHVSITSKNDYCGELSKIDLGKAQFTLSSMGPRGNVGGGSNQIDSLTLSNLQDKFYIALTSQYKYTVDLLNQLNVNDPIFYEIDTFYKSSENEK